MTASEITRETETGLSLKELMLLPVILLWLTFQAFAQHVAKLKEARRTRPLPKNWQEHWPNLRLAEWHIRSLTSFGIEVLLAGKELDVHELAIVLEPPEDFGAMPQSALEMHRRFEAIARFHADPERYIRRAAERVIARDGEIDPLSLVHPLRAIFRALVRSLRRQRPPTPPTTGPSSADSHCTLVCTPVWTHRIRAPPFRRTPENQTYPTRRPARRERETVRDADATTRNLAQLSGPPVARPEERAYPPAHDHRER